MGHINPSVCNFVAGKQTLVTMTYLQCYINVGDSDYLFFFYFTKVWLTKLNRIVHQMSSLFIKLTHNRHTNNVNPISPPFKSVLSTIFVSNISTIIMHLLQSSLKTSGIHVILLWSIHATFHIDSKLF